VSILASKSGLIQSVTPSQSIESYQSDGVGGEAVLENLQQANNDIDSPQSIPAVPTTEAPYDGQVCFGLFHVDETLDGLTT
jgi:hypothetical protein